MRTSHARGEKPELLIIDTKRLRQAGLTRLVETWAGVMGFPLVRFATSPLPPRPGATNEPTGSCKSPDGIVLGRGVRHAMCPSVL